MLVLQDAAFGNPYRQSLHKLQDLDDLGVLPLPALLLGLSLLDENLLEVRITLLHNMLSTVMHFLSLF